MRLPLPPAIAKAAMTSTEEDRRALGQEIVSSLLQGVLVDDLTERFARDGWDRSLVQWWITQTQLYGKAIEPFVQEEPGAPRIEPPPVASPPMPTRMGGFTPIGAPPTQSAQMGTFQAGATPQGPKTGAWILGSIGLVTALFLVVRVFVEVAIPGSAWLLLLPLFFAFWLVPALRGAKGVAAALLSVIGGVTALALEPSMPSPLRFAGKPVSRSEARLVRADIKRIMPGGILDGTLIDDFESESNLSQELVRHLRSATTAAAGARMVRQEESAKLSSPDQVSTDAGRAENRKIIAKIKSEIDPSRATQTLKSFDEFVSASFGAKLTGTDEIIEAHQKSGAAFQEALDHYLTLMDHLAKSNAEFDKKGNRWLFGKRADIDRFDRIFDDIEKTMTEANERHRELMQLQSKHMPSWTKFLRE